MALEDRLSEPILRVGSADAPQPDSEELFAAVWAAGEVAVL